METKTGGEDYLGVGRGARSRSEPANLPAAAAAAASHGPIPSTSRHPLDADAQVNMCLATVQLSSVIVVIVIIIITLAVLVLSFLCATPHARSRGWRTPARLPVRPPAPYCTLQLWPNSQLPAPNSHPAAGPSASAQTQRNPLASPSRLPSL
ncbi:uncharacterized protein J3D65DRAFT_400764 [Phyllosticta citribraziliensis]|uniref:Uncharacterized protein n=1 Tax=Phyllosticta citribraziliensis TaxID=989973 RepID=A0ABR1LLH8_9PEZI